ncbi:MAG: tetratricopeptide repeat protein [Deltaproteobacteria bacterium]|nr:tetratricopeptide repeat protein [Deltaproteobacteria bacterium]
MYSVQKVSNVLGVPADRLRSYMKAGFVTPARDEDGELRLSFQDMVLLRKVEGLLGQQIPAKRVHQALRRLKQTLGSTRPLAGLNLDVDGDRLIVDEGNTRWDPTSGQMFLSFAGGARKHSQASETNIAPLALAREASAQESQKRKKLRGERGPDGLTAHEHFERGCGLEEQDAAAARDAYQAAIDLDPAHADAHINLGRLLHESGHPEAAQLHYRVALTVRPEDPTAFFNLGVALEDTGRRAEAVEAYESSIGIDPSNADAHYNLARLLEQLGRPETAVRHLLIYRQLTKRR